MINCVNCGVSFSDTLPLCPVCGAPRPIYENDNDKEEIAGWFDEIEDVDFFEE